MSVITTKECKAITIQFYNGWMENKISAVAYENGEYWFTIGYYKTLKNAKKAAVRRMLLSGLTFDPAELEAATVN